MTSIDAANAALEDLGLVEGLATDCVVDNLRGALRSGDLDRRKAAFWLAEVEERDIYDDRGYSSTYALAKDLFGLSKRRTRELVRMGKKLRVLPLIDLAFLKGHIGHSKLLLLISVATPEHEKTWLELALDHTVDELKGETLGRQEGEPPRDSSNRRQTREVKKDVRMSFDSLTYASLETLQQRLTEERGRPVTQSEVAQVAIDIALQYQKDLESGTLKPAPSHVCVHTEFSQGNPSGPEPGAGLMVMTDLGPLPIDGCEEVDGVVSAYRSECQCCDGRHIGEEGADEIDATTPSWLRGQVILRDKGRCRCCGERYTIHVHHIDYRKDGGRTKAWNLITLCVLCRIRHKMHYAESRIMPRWARIPACAGVPGASHAA